MSEKKELLIYGAYGYTGKMICDRLKAQNSKFIVAGRDKVKTEQVATEVGMPARVFALDDVAAGTRALEDVQIVLHCAGPYSATSKPMLDLCIKAKAHYLDITGEYKVIEAIAARNDELRQAGIIAIPAVGMDVVPSDCLLSYVAGRLPTANDLKLYIKSSSKLSTGTTKTLIESLGSPNVVRKDGKLVEEPFGSGRVTVDFPDGPAYLMGAPWGDIASAYHTTNVPNIRVYMRAAPEMVTKAFSVLSPVIKSGPAQYALKTLATWLVKGETFEQCENSDCEFIAEARDSEGKKASAYLKIKNGYAFTVLSSIEIVRRIMKSGGKPGFHTPAEFFGADFVLEIEGSSRKDLD